MSEAKRRAQLKQAAFGRIDAEFRAAGINTSEFGFYDEPAFLAQERRDPAYLEKYGLWVQHRPLDPAYEAHAREVVPKLAQLVADALIEDDYQGGCVVAYSLMSRALDRLGVWSVGVQGAANLSIDGTDWERSLHTVDVRDFPGALLGHAWAVAPPYRIVDTSLSLQRWGSDPMRRHIPNVILESGDGQLFRPRVDDVVSAKFREGYAMREGRYDPQLHHRLEPQLRGLGGDFPAIEVTRDPLRVRYVPVAIKLTDCGLADINREGSIGRTGRAIWNDVIAPEFDLPSDL